MIHETQWRSVVSLIRWLACLCPNRCCLGVRNAIAAVNGEPLVAEVKVWAVDHVIVLCNCSKRVRSSGFDSTFPSSNYEPCNKVPVDRYSYLALRISLPTGTLCLASICPLYSSLAFCIKERTSHRRLYGGMTVRQFLNEYMRTYMEGHYWFIYE